MTTAIANAVNSPDHQSALKAMRETQRAFQPAAPRGSSWEDPLFLSWLILARVWRLDRNALNSVNGIMTIKQETAAGQVTWDHAKIERIGTDRLDRLFKDSIADYAIQDL